MTILKNTYKVQWLKLLTLKQTQKQIYMYIYNVLRMYIKQFADMDTIFFS